MRRLYSWLARGAAPLAFAWVLWRGLKDRSYWQGLAQRFGGGEPLPAGDPAQAALSVWVHAVSLGEMTAAAPLVRAIRQRHAQIPLVITTATPAGRARAAALFGDAADVRFLPYDTPGSVRRFMARTRPRLGIVMETELWPNLFAQARRLRIPMLLASARLSDKSVARYRRLAALFGAVFSDDVFVAAQSSADAQRFMQIGAAASRTSVVGNVKFDLQLDAAAIQAGKLLRAALDRGGSAGGRRPVWIAGSTHAGEEEQVLDAHTLLLETLPNALLLLAPRHKDRFASVADLIARRGFKFTRRSAPADAPGAETPRAETAVMLVDTVGELATLYAAADVAFVGGSLVAVGGHNMLEPAALELPVLTGPSYFNSREPAQLLLAQGAALQVPDGPALAAALCRLLQDAAERGRMGRAGAALVAANRGAVERLLALIEPLLAGSDPAAAAANR